MGKTQTGAFDNQKCRARIGEMPMSRYPVSHQVDFDPAGRLFAEHWLILPRVDVRPEIKLDRDFAVTMAVDYFDAVRRINRGLYRVEFTRAGIWVRTLMATNVLVFQDPQLLLSPSRAEVSWSIVGGFMRARRVREGGRFCVGGEWTGGNQLRLYSKLDGYTSRLIEIFGVRLGRVVYRLTQGVSHNYIISQFLREQANRITRR